MAGVFEDFGGNVAKRAGKGGKLLVRGMRAFWAVEDEHRSGERTGDVHAKADDDNVAVRVRGLIEDVLGSTTSVNEERVRRAHLRLQWTMLQW